jgi:acetyl esterase/lipase
MSSVFVDLIHKYIIYQLPFSWQRWLRVQGLKMYLNDITALMLAPMLLLFKPSVAISTFVNAFFSKTFRIEGESSSKPRLEVHKLRNKKNKKNDKHQIFLFVHGGSWGSGQLWQYRAAALAFGRKLNAQTVAILSYDYYPKSSILQQRDSVLKAISFIHSNITFQKYILDEPLLNAHQNTSPLSLILCGHSSGANIAALSVLSLYEQEQKHQNEDFSLSSFIPSCDVFIGLAGPYNLIRQFDAQCAKGAQHFSPMLGAAGGYDQLADCSPSLLLPAIINKQKENKQKSKPPHTKVFLLHGFKDEVVAYEQSMDFLDILKEGGFDSNLYCFDGDHGAPLLQILSSSRNTWNVTMNSMEDVRKLLST